MSDNISARGLTRREFLKTTTAAAAVAAVGDKLFGGPVSSLVRNAEAAAVTEDVWIPTACNLCDEECLIQARRVNGVAVELKGHPEDPRSGGTMCARGRGGLMTLYNPYRLKAPMKRTNPQKGVGVDPKWVEISWDEALDTVAAQLKKIKQDDPRKLAHWSGRRGSQVQLSLTSVFGTPNTGLSAGGQMCGGGYHTGSDLNIGESSARVDARYCKYVLQIGAGYGGGNKASPTDIRLYTKARERGLKLVTIDPIQSPSGGVKADEWIPIRPGTDLALLLAMINVLMNEIKTIDTDFIKKQTNGPYLVGADGWYVRAKEPLIDDPIRKEKVGPPLIWDPVDNKAKAWNDKTIKDYALEGTFKINGVDAKPGYQLLKDHVKQYTPEWAFGITTVPADTIRRITTEFADAAEIGRTISIDGLEMPFRPAAVIMVKGGCGHLQALDIGIAEGILAKLVGSINVPGSYRAAGPPNLPANPADGMLIPFETALYRPIKFPPSGVRANELYPVSYTVKTTAFRAINEPAKYYQQYPIEAWAIEGGNPIMGLTNPEVPRQALSKAKFIYKIATNFDEPTEWADIVMPEPTYLETTRDTEWRDRPSFTPEFSNKIDNTLLRQPIVKPIYNTREGADINIDLAEKIGILYGKGGLNERLNRNLQDPNKLDVNKKYTYYEILDRTLKSKWGAEFGLDYFRQVGWKGQFKYPEKEFYGPGLAPETKYPIYAEYWKWVGVKWAEELKKFNITLPGLPSNDFATSQCKALPEWHATIMHPLPAGFDLYAIHYKSNLQTMVMPMENPWMYEVSQQDPYAMKVWMNAKTGKAKGLKDGDLVWVESSTGGKIKGEVKLSECVHTDVAAMTGCYGHSSANLNPIATEGPHFNTLLSSDEMHVDPVTMQIEDSAAVKVYKA